METEFKVNDKIRITKNGPSTYNFFTIGKEFFITDIKDYDKKIIILDDTYTISPYDSKDSCVYGDWELVQEKPRFYNAQVGDLVYCRLQGNGSVEEINTAANFPVICKFNKSEQKESYLFSGKPWKSCSESTLFYRKGEEKYLTERPDPDIDWSKVPMGTKVKVWNIDEEPQDFCTDYFMGYFPELPKPFWTFNNSDKVEACSYKFCKLAEPCKPEWIK